ncbi:NhaC Na:H antiporter (NhaC) family protein [Achlya hypogyna]|uniref:NhaC Na:H antiporter (NhaC) family protein n=1 Tax=Achlya hypogyna TaxID=1202772 RepID=A0A1V9YJ58_ACHHY|nr:NhaC Na:H antiporter (NhaC) family protein [Achlya hypogyna]
MMRRTLLAAAVATAAGLDLQVPSVILTSVPFTATLALPGGTYPGLLQYAIEDSAGASLASGQWNATRALTVAPTVALVTTGTHDLHCRVWAGNASTFAATATRSVRSFPGYVALLPPFVTLLCSLLFGQVMIALLVGIWSGAALVSGGNLWLGFLHTFDVYWVDAFVDRNHAGVLLFTIILGGTIGVVQKGGGAHGLAHLAASTMRTSLRMQLATWVLCCCLFFDDYSMILILGSSLRQILPRTGVSKEKFAAIIHTMGVCLPSMAPVSSWVGVEIGYVAAVLQTLQLDWDPFVTCLSSLQYRLFPILFIAFIFITIIFEKDFGPMLKYERGAAESAEEPREPEEDEEAALPPAPLGPMEPDPRRPMRAVNAVVPFAIIVAATFVGMILDGFQALALQFPGETFGVLDALSHSDSVAALIRASALGWVAAVALLLLQRIVSMQQIMGAWVEGVKDVIEPTLILTLAWALGAVIGEVQTAAYIASTLHGQIAPGYLPAIASVLCCVVSFATGTSFGTMAIMLPIICPLSYKVSGQDAANLMQCIGAVLGSSVFGNACSPIADTSIITALSAGLPLANHVESVLPYAVVVAATSSAGTFFLGTHVFTTFTAFALCFAVLLGLVAFCGSRVPSRFRSASNASSVLSLSPSHRYSFLSAVSPPHSAAPASREQEPLLPPASTDSGVLQYVKTLFPSTKKP